MPWHKILTVGLPLLAVAGTLLLAFMMLRRWRGQYAAAVKYRSELEAKAAAYAALQASTSSSATSSGNQVIVLTGNANDDHDTLDAIGRLLRDARPVAPGVPVPGLPDAVRDRVGSGHDGWAAVSGPDHGELVERVVERRALLTRYRDGGPDDVEPGRGDAGQGGAASDES